MSDAYIAIENPMAGESYYDPDHWGVYRYDTHPPGSVLAGQERRTSLGSFDSEAEARAAYPDAVVAGGTGFASRPLPRFPEDEPDLDRGYGESGEDMPWGPGAAVDSLSFPYGVVTAARAPAASQPEGQAAGPDAPVIDDVRSAGQLREFIAAGGQPEYLMFWGPEPPPGGEAGPHCLSQWYPAGFTVDGVSYASAEHFMMAGKARLFGDEDAVRQILAEPDPREVQAIGRAIRGYDSATWAEHRFGIVAEGNTAKFGQNPELRDFLLGTGRRVLVEASPVDRIWGIGLGENSGQAASPEHWQGQNLLGFALMEARQRLTPGGSQEGTRGPVAQFGVRAGQQAIRRAARPRQEPGAHRTP